MKCPFHKTTMAMVLALGTTLGLHACTTSPITGRSQLMLIGEGVEKKIGLAAYKAALQDETITQDPRAVEPIWRIVKRLASVSERPDFAWEVKVIKNDKMVQAFVMSGGKIAVYTGIFPIARTEAGMAIILGHEVGHAIARHGAERISQGLLAQLGEVALASAVQSSRHSGAILAAYGAGARVGVLLPYSRFHESEADRIGLMLAAKAGYDPRAATEVWKRMAAHDRTRIPEFLSTHPQHETRLADMERLLPEAMAHYRRHRDAGQTLLPHPETIK